MTNTDTSLPNLRKDPSLPVFSAIMPSYNQGDFIREALDSIFAQNYPNLEVIVVDGGSTDHTLDVLRSYGERIRWVSEKDRGQTDALNKGFRMARGEIIAWLNSDDAYDTGAFLTAGRYFAEHSECMWLYGRCIIINEKSEEIRKWVTAYKNFFLRRYSYNLLLVQNVLSQMAIFFRKQTVDEIGELKVELWNGMDYDYWLRIGKKYDPHFIDQNFGKFRLHTGSKTIYDVKDLFDSDYACAREHGKDRPFLVFLHKLFHLAILTVYPLIGRLDVFKSRRENRRRLNASRRNHRPSSQSGKPE